MLSIESHRVRHDSSDLACMPMHGRRKWQPTPVFLPRESQGQRSLVGCCLQGRTESDTTEATQQQQQSHGSQLCASLAKSKSCWQLETDQSGSIYTTKISKHYKPALFFPERGLFGMYQHTMAADSRQLGIPHRRGEWRARTVSIRGPQILENKSLLCMLLIRLIHLHILHQSSNNNRYQCCTVVSTHQLLKTQNQSIFKSKRKENKNSSDFGNQTILFPPSQQLF